MKSTATFVALQYVVGFAFCVLGLFLLPEKESWSMETSILYALSLGFVCMLIGVGLVGYFHLRVKKITYKFVVAMLLSLAGAILFGLLSILVADFGFLSLILSLTGAVFGFNLIATTAIRKDRD